jgi:hypothetical protein
VTAFAAAARLRPHLAALTLALVVLVTAWGVRASEGRHALESCDAALARKDHVEAIVFARAAAQARCPWCGAPELGYARLYAIAKEAEGRGDDATAVSAWRAVRSATLSTTVIDASPARRERADAEIARFEHRIDAATAAAGGGAASPAASEEKLRGALAASPIPSASVFVLLAIGGALFLLGAVRFVRSRSFAPTELGIALAGFACAAAGLLLF